MTKEELIKYAEELTQGLPEAEQKAVLQVLGKNEFASKFVPRPEVDRAISQEKEATSKQQKDLQTLKDWVHTKALPYVDRLEAVQHAYRNEHGDLDPETVEEALASLKADPTARPKAKGRTEPRPADSGKLMEDVRTLVNRSLEQFGNEMLGVTRGFAKALSTHQQTFGKSLDVDRFYEFAETRAKTFREQNPDKPIPTVDSFYQDFVSEDLKALEAEQKKEWEEKIRAEERQKFEDDLARRGLRPEAQKTELRPAIFDTRPKDQIDKQPTQKEVMEEFMEGWLEGAKTGT